MKRMNLVKVFGVALLTTTLILNLQYALVDYGMSENSLGTQLIAQTNGTGGNTNGGNSNGGDSNGGGSNGSGSSGGTSNGGSSNGDGTTNAPGGQQCGSGYNNDNYSYIYCYKNRGIFGLGNGCKYDQESICKVSPSEWPDISF